MLAFIETNPLFGPKSGIRQRFKVLFTLGAIFMRRAALENIECHSCNMIESGSAQSTEKADYQIIGLSISQPIGWRIAEQTEKQGTALHNSFPVIGCFPNAEVGHRP